MDVGDRHVLGDWNWKLAMSIHESHHISGLHWGQETQARASIWALSGLLGEKAIKQTEKMALEKWGYILRMTELGSHFLVRHGYRVHCLTRT